MSLDFPPYLEPEQNSPARKSMTLSRSWSQPANFPKELNFPFFTSSKKQISQGAPLPQGVGMHSSTNGYQASCSPRSSCSLRCSLSRGVSLPAEVDGFGLGAAPSPPRAHLAYSDPPTEAATASATLVVVVVVVVGSPPSSRISATHASRASAALPTAAACSRNTPTIATCSSSKATPASAQLLAHSPGESYSSEPSQQSQIPSITREEGNELGRNPLFSQ
mmetsp:Transcript_85896/g.195840  ORF Transcript_85896/g.195840 Transcript_85896/m.195840 type:complete len:221 (-) Transcript_85896:137-799(-)